MFGKTTTHACGVFCALLIILPQAVGQQTENSLFGISIRNAAIEQRLIRTRTEQEAVATNILNSDVQGQQTTTTETRLRILPDGGSLRFDVVSTGDVKSQTTGINSQAMIDSTGRHHFEITKPFWFNGTTFFTQPGHGTIQASQAPQRVVSAVGAAMPLFRPLSDRIAWEQVNRRQGEINQAVAADVSRTVLPKVDRIVDEEFAQLGRQIATVQTQVERDFATVPLSWLARSSDQSFSFVAVPQKQGVANGDFNSATVDVPQLADGEEIAFSMSETMATALLEKYIPGGLMLTDTQVEKASKLWNQAGDEKWTIESMIQLFREFENNASAKPTMFSVQFAKVQPFAIHFDRGDVCIDSSFQIIPKIGSPSGWMKTTWRMRGQGVSDDQWAVALHRVDVGETYDSIPVADVENIEASPPALRIPSGTTFESNDRSAAPQPDPDSNELEPQVTTVESGTVWMTIVKNATQSLLKQIPPATLPKEFEVPTTLPGSPRIRLVRIESAEGTLRAAFRLVDCNPDI